MNKARLLGCGMIFVSFTCFLTALPYAIYGPNVLAGHSTSIVNSNTNQTKTTVNYEFCSAENSEDCSESSVSQHTTVWFAYCIIWISAFLYGIGHCVFFTLLLPYLDDNLDKRKSPIYISGLSSFTGVLIT